MSERDIPTTGLQLPKDPSNPGKIHIPESELSIEAVHASGPGGQNINKVATAIRLTFDPSGSSLLDEASRARFTRIASSYLDGNGRMTILARRFRSQEQNRRDAIERLKHMIAAALVVPSIRQPSRPTHSSQIRRLERKSWHKHIKQYRRKPSAVDE